MRVLYITNYNSIYQAGSFISDYQNDLLFYGLYELQQEGVITELVDSTPIIHLYKENESKIDKRLLWGGFNSFWLIDKDDVDRTNLEQKIADKYFDIVVYGAVRRCTDYYDLVSKVYPNDRVIVVDGNDDTDIDERFTKHSYFKRELLQYKVGVSPISFAIPECKILPPNYNKTQDWATCIPGDKSTYIFTDEQSYMQDMSDSFFAYTTKKAGWDQLRIYEILAAGCLPYFPDLNNCPIMTMRTYPKFLVHQASELVLKKFDEKQYYFTRDLLLEITKEQLTTKALAKYVLNEI